MPVDLIDNSVFQKFFTVAEFINFSKEERHMYDQDLKRRMDNAAAEEYIKYVSKAEGKAEGKLEEKVEIAKKMKSRGVLFEVIAEDTGLSLEEIQAL